jgi:hypothetical protein
LQKNLSFEGGEEMTKRKAWTLFALGFVVIGIDGTLRSLKVPFAGILVIPAGILFAMPMIRWALMTRLKE